MSLDQIENDCSPITQQKDTLRIQSWKGVPIQPEQVANPCGLIARSIFTDTFQIQWRKNAQIVINQTNIAWSLDKELIHQSPNSVNEQWYDVKRESFLVWMRTAFLNNFKKLYGRIDKDLPKGEYMLTINNQFDVTLFGGEKWIVLSTTNILGGKNTKMAKCYILYGTICLIVAGFLGYKRRKIQLKYGVRVQMKTM